jgi:hypothetical protein
MSTAALVCTRKYEGGIIYVSHQASVGISLYQRWADSKDYQSAMIVSTSGNSRRKPIYVETVTERAPRLPANTKWCVG